MSKAKTTPYTLARGRTQPYRKTVTYLKEQPLIAPDGAPVKDGAGKPVHKMLPDPKRPPVQFVFEAEKDVELTDEELGLMQDVLDGHYIEPTNRDAKGRQRAAPADYVPGAEDTIDKLEKQVEDLSAENAELKSQLAEYEEADEEE